MTGAIYIITVLIFAYVVRREPWVLLRPSMWVLFAMLVRINGAAAFAGPAVDYELRQASALRFATVLFPVLVLIWVGASGGLTARARAVYDTGRASVSLPGIGRPEDAALKLMGGLSLLIMLAYSVVVPPQRSGLAAILFNPVESAGAREESLKLISFAPLRYAYLWHMEILAPVLLVLVVFGLRGGVAGRRMLKWGLAGALFVSVMISGARGPAGSLMVVLGVAYLIRAGVFKGLRALTIAVACAVFLALVLSIMRDGRVDLLSPELLWSYLSKGLFTRVFVTPYETGVLTNMYTEMNGLLGVRNIRPLALLFGQEFVALPNAVGLSYMYAKVMSVSANTSFLFDLQASFGIWPGWFVSALALGALDFLMLAFRRLNGLVLVAFYATMMTFLLALVSSAYTTSLITHGIVPTAMIAAFWGWRHFGDFAARRTGGSQ